MGLHEYGAGEHPGIDAHRAILAKAPIQPRGENDLMRYRVLDRCGCSGQVRSRLRAHDCIQRVPGRTLHIATVGLASNLSELSARSSTATRSTAGTFTVDNEGDQFELAETSLNVRANAKIYYSNFSRPSKDAHAS